MSWNVSVLHNKEVVPHPQDFPKCQETSSQVKPIYNYSSTELNSVSCTYQSTFAWFLTHSEFLGMQLLNNWDKIVLPPVWDFSKSHPPFCRIVSLKPVPLAVCELLTHLYGSALVAVTPHIGVSDHFIMSSGIVMSGLLHIIMYTLTTSLKFPLFTVKCYVDIFKIMWAIILN